MAKRRLPENRKVHGVKAVALLQHREDPGFEIELETEQLRTQLRNLPNEAIYLGFDNIGQALVFARDLVERIEDQM